MNEWAAPDYEPTLEELHEAFSGIYDSAPGSHGHMTLLPSMEGHMWTIEGVWWTGRRTNEDGMIEVTWWRRA